MVWELKPTTQKLFESTLHFLERLSLTAAITLGIGAVAHTKGLITSLFLKGVIIWVMAIVAVAVALIAATLFTTAVAAPVGGLKAKKALGSIAWCISVPTAMGVCMFAARVSVIDAKQPIPVVTCLPAQAAPATLDH